jgi:hypothetical protein
MFIVLVCDVKYTRMKIIVVAYRKL